jgi:pimeloyl-ACP methyl ester carboxylesterase
MTTAISLSAADHAWLDRELYPFAPHFIELEGQRLHYVDEGEGKPVLFVHGTPSWSFEWRAQIHALSQAGWRCIALDHLGFGLSDKPEAAAYKPEDHARRLGQWVERLDLRDVTLVVHDFGGPIGLGAALEAPERYSRSIVINSWLWGTADQPAAARISRFVRSPWGRFLYRTLNASPRWLLPAAFADKRRLTPSVHRHYVAPFRTRRERTAPWVLGCELLGSSSFYEGLWRRRAQIPELTAILWGMRDPAFRADSLARWQAAFPHARVTRFDDAGHFPQEEAPQALTQALFEALGEPAAARARGASESL